MFSLLIQFILLSAFKLKGVVIHGAVDTACTVVSYIQINTVRTLMLIQLADMENELDDRNFTHRIVIKYSIKIFVNRCFPDDNFILYI